MYCTVLSIPGQRPLFGVFNPDDNWMIHEHVDALGKNYLLFGRIDEKRERNEQGRGDNGKRQRWEQRFEYFI